MPAGRSIVGGPSFGGRSRGGAAHAHGEAVRKFAPNRPHSAHDDEWRLAAPAPPPPPPMLGGSKETCFCLFGRVPACFILF